MEAMLCVDVEPAKLNTYLAAANSYWLEQKVDGQRVLADVRDGVTRFYRRDGKLRTNATAARIERALATLPDGHYILDGEIVLDGEYRFYVFDMPLVENAQGQVLVDCTDQYKARRAALELVFEHWAPDDAVRLMRCERKPGGKRELAEAVRSMGGEGVVLKDPAQTYQPGKRGWVKIKFTKTVDCVVTGLRWQGKDNATLGIYDDDRLVEVGRCSTIGKPALEVGDVVEMRYLYAVNRDEPRLYQPRLLRVRDDKRPELCTLDQLQFTKKEVL